MLKQCFKKMFLIVFYIGLFLAFAFVSAFLLTMLFNRLFTKSVIETISLTITFLLWFFLIFSLRLKNKKKELQFIDDVNKNKFSFFKDVKMTIISFDNLEYIISLTVLSAPFLIFIAMDGKTPIIPMIIGTLLLLIIIDSSFSIINGLTWYIIHKIWTLKKYNEK